MPGGGNRTVRGSESFVLAVEVWFGKTPSDLKINKMR